jgi:hypothetical protein
MRITGLLAKLAKSLASMHREQSDHVETRAGLYGPRLPKTRRCCWFKSCCHGCLHHLDVEWINIASGVGRE